MPEFDFTFQESSPLISYSPGWDGRYHSTDPFRNKYTGIFRTSNQPRTTATLSFLGTGVSIFGALRDNHGNYSVVLDDQPSVMRNGFDAPPYSFNTSLWSANDLPFSQHTVALTNIPVDSRPYVDIDFITIKRSIGGPGDTIHNLTLDNTAPSPSVNFTGSWQEIPQSSAHNNSLHRTAAVGAQVILQFRGCCIEVYGQYANANFTAVVDDQTPMTLRGFNVDLPDVLQQPQTLLYLADNLDEDKVHKVTLTNLDHVGSRPFYFDYAMVRSTKSISLVQGTNSTSPGGSTPNSTSTADSQRKHVPVAPIVGAVVGTLALALILFFVYYLIRRRRTSSGTKSSRSNLKAQPYILPYSSVAQTSYASLPTTGPASNNHNNNSNNATNASSNLSIRPAASAPDFRSLRSGANHQPTPSQGNSEVSSSSAGLTSVQRSRGREKGATRPLLESEPIQERDAGTVSITQSENHPPAPNYLPPAYDSTWNQSGQ